MADSQVVTLEKKLKRYTRTLATPGRCLIYSSVLTKINHNSVSKRVLFLFTDILILTEGHSTEASSYVYKDEMSLQNSQFVTVGEVDGRYLFLIFVADHRSYLLDCENDFELKSWVTQLNRQLASLDLQGVLTSLDGVTLDFCPPDKPRRWEKLLRNYDINWKTKPKPTINRSSAPPPSAPSSSYGNVPAPPPVGASVPAPYPISGGPGVPPPPPVSAPAAPPVPVAPPAPGGYGPGAGAGAPPPVSSSVIGEKPQPKKLSAAAFNFQSSVAPAPVASTPLPAPKKLSAAAFNFQSSVETPAPAAAAPAPKKLSAAALTVQSSISVDAPRKEPIVRSGQGIGALAAGLGSLPMGGARPTYQPTVQREDDPPIRSGDGEGGEGGGEGASVGEVEVRATAKAVKKPPTTKRKARAAAPAATTLPVLANNSQKQAIVQKMEEEERERQRIEAERIEAERREAERIEYERLEAIRLAEEAAAAQAAAAYGGEGGY